MSGRPRTARIRTDGRLGSTPDTDYCTSFRHRPHDGVQSYRYIGTVISMSARYRSILLPRVLDVEMSAGGRVSRLESSDNGRSTEPRGRPDVPTRCGHPLLRPPRPMCPAAGCTGPRRNGTYSEYVRQCSRNITPVRSVSVSSSRLPVVRLVTRSPGNGPIYSGITSIFLETSARNYRRVPSAPRTDGFENI